MFDQVLTPCFMETFSSKTELCYTLYYTEKQLVENDWNWLRKKFKTFWVRVYRSVKFC